MANSPGLWLIFRLSAVQKNHLAAFVVEKILKETLNGFPVINTDPQALNRLM